MLGVPQDRVPLSLQGSATASRNWIESEIPGWGAIITLTSSARADGNNMSLTFTFCHKVGEVDVGNLTFLRIKNFFEFFHLHDSQMYHFRKTMENAETRVKYYCITNPENVYYLKQKGFLNYDFYIIYPILYTDTDFFIPKIYTKSVYKMC